MNSKKLSATNFFLGHGSATRRAWVVHWDIYLATWSAASDVFNDAVHLVAVRTATIPSCSCLAGQNPVACVY